MKVDCARPHFIIWTKEDALRDVVSGLLGDQGFNALKVHDKHEMFRFLEEFQPAIVILDGGLPPISGFEVHEIIKRVDRFKDTNVILLSSLPQCVPGVDECIEKDQVESLLLSRIRRFVPEEFAMPESERQMHEEARRFAKIIVADIVLYNQDKAEKGSKDGTFYEILKDEIEEGRRFYSSKIPAAIISTTHYFDEAIQKFIRRLCSESQL